MHVYITLVSEKRQGAFIKAEAFIWIINRDKVVSSTFEFGHIYGISENSINTASKKSRSLILVYVSTNLLSKYLG